MKNFRMLSWIVLTACLLFLCSCGGNRPVELIKAKAMFTNQELSLPISSDNASLGALRTSGHYGYMKFASDMTGEELYEAIRQADPSLDCTLGDHSILISRDNAAQTKDDYWISWYKEHWYTFSGMRAGLVTGIKTDGMRKSRAVLLPYHLVSDDRVGTSFSVLYLNAEYETTAGLEEFLGFYQDSGWYEVEQKDGCVILNGYQNPSAVTGTQEDADTFGSLEFDKKLKIQFRDFEDKRYFSFTEAE